MDESPATATEQLTREQTSQLLEDHHLELKKYDSPHSQRVQYAHLGTIRWKTVEYAPGWCLERTNIGIVAGPFETHEEAVAGLLELIAKEEAEQAAENASASRYRNTEAERRLERVRARLPYPGEDLDSFKPKSGVLAGCVDTAQQYVRNLAWLLKEGHGLVLCGPSGAGKTRLACALAESLAAAGFEPRYTTAAHALRAIDELGRVPDPILLDDVAVQDFDNPSQAQLAALVARDMEVLLKARLEFGYPTIMIAECDVATLERYLGSAMFERLRSRTWRIVEF